MIKVFYLPLIAILLFFSFIVNSKISSIEDDALLLYVSDFNNIANDHKIYTILDVESGQTVQLSRQADFQEINYGYGEMAPPTRVEYTSPYDESVRIVMLRDYSASNQDKKEQLYRVRADDQLEPVLMGSYIFISWKNFTDNGRYVYLYAKSSSASRYTYYTLYQYDIQSTELQIVAENVQNTYLNCQNERCLLISGLRDDEDTPQTLFILDKNLGELQEIETADEVFIPRWWRESELLYAYFDGVSHTTITTYSLETKQYHNLARIEGQGLGSLQKISTDNDQTADVLLVTIHSLEEHSVWDIYVVNGLDENPRSYPLGMQTAYPYELTLLPSDGSLLLASVSIERDRPNNIVFIDNIAVQPIIEELTHEDFDAEVIRDFRSVSNLGDMWLISADVSDDEWRYYSIHIPTRTITQLASFNTKQWVVQTLFSEDKKWLALSIEENSQYYVEIISLDGRQSPQRWNVDTDSYVCLLGWYEPDFTPPPCSLYFGIG